MDINSESRIRKRVLLITREIPFPFNRSGGIVSIYPVIKYLGQDPNYSIDLLFPTSTGENDLPDKIKYLNNYCNNVFTFNFKRHWLYRVIDAIVHPLPLVFMLYTKHNFIRNIYPIISSEINKYDVILCQDTHFARFIPLLNSKGKNMLVVGDYLTQVYRTVSRSSKNVLTKLYYMITCNKLISHEEKIYQLFDDVIYVSPDDKRSFLNEHPKYKGSITVIPNGLELDTYIQSDSMSLGNSLLFTGNMNYLPNRQAAIWFYEYVFSQLNKIDSSIKLYIVGIDADKYLSFDDKNVSIHNSVPSLIPYIKGATIVISPLMGAPN